jgi:hypothetical protein
MKVSNKIRMVTKQTLIIASSFILTSCYDCSKVYTITELDSPQRINMHLNASASRVTDGLDLDFVFPFENSEYPNIEHVNIVFIDKKLKDTLVYEKEYSFFTEESFNDGSSKGSFKDFIEIPSIYRVPMGNINYVNYSLLTDIKNKELIAIINSTLMDSTGRLMVFENKYEITNDTRCNWHFALH